MPEDPDLSAIARLAHALAGEIVAERLIEKLMAAAVEHAAAERGLLLLQKGTELHLEALACICEGAVSVQRPGRPIAGTDLPATLVLHVARSGRSVVLGDATLSNAFSHDPYLQEKAPRSLMCLPLGEQGALMGMLYLEHARAADVFTPARHAALDLLSCQAAISLQNAQLHAMLEQEKALRKAAEAAMRRAEERYALAVEAATDGHADWIVDGDVLYASPRLRELWGISPERAFPNRRQMLDLFPFHPDDRDRVLSLLDQHLRGNTRRLEFDARVVRRGEVRWIHWTTLYERDATGKLLRTSTATTDVTQRMRAEEEVRSSEQRYALALVGSKEGVFDWDLRTDLIYAPRHTQELLGLPVGACWRPRVEWERQIEYHAGDCERMHAALDAHLAGKTPMYEMEVRVVLAGGEIRCFHHRGTVLRDASGTPYRMVGAVGDITERKRDQEEMARLECRLRQAERFEAMGTLAGGIAHDFNNILAAILGFGERALRTVKEGSRLHRDLSNVLVAGERGRTLVERILSFSRGTAVERVPVHVEKEAREALDLLRARLPAHVRLRSCLRTGRAAMLGEAVQIHRLVMNLVTNAAHAMAQAGTLTVTLQATDLVQERQATVGLVAAGAWIVLQVADEGTGMTPEVLERIFDPFFTTKAVGVGTGLGLSLVMRIVTQAGGAIDVQTTPGRGSVFTIYLPRTGDAPEEPPDVKTELPRGRGQRVMVVDDDEALLKLTTYALQELGYQPAGYSSARTALAAFRATPDDFDALVTDLRMPGMAGDALIREARNLRPLLPAILVSGYVGDAMQEHYDSGLGDEVLTKPLRSDALAASLAGVLALS